MAIEIPEELRFLSELYASDAPGACLLTEYPSSNSRDTRFQNRSKFIIHDPFPPPPRELLKTLGPHHLMCAWGNHVPVTSEVPPPEALLQHWGRIFGDAAIPDWVPFNQRDHFITLFPHESLSPESQVVDPQINYELHSKEVIAHIDCPQADVYDAVQFPCIVKLSHGYAGLGNFKIVCHADEQAMRNRLANHWPDATLVINSVIENVVGDFGVQFYLRRDGSVVWLGLTEQHFTDAGKWCGGTYSKHLQLELIEPFEEIVNATAAYLRSRGCFGVVGVDILRNDKNEVFLVDVNPRLTGITPFLMASRMFSESYPEGVYRASFQFDGTLAELVERAESFEDGCVLILSAFEDSTETQSKTICHLSASSTSQQRNCKILDRLAAH